MSEGHIRNKLAGSTEGGLNEEMQAHKHITQARPNASKQVNVQVCVEQKLYLIEKQI